MTASFTHSGPWNPEPFVADDGSLPFERFVEELLDFKLEALLAAIDRVLVVRGIDLGRTEWLKALGQGLHEFRVRHDADEIARMFGGRPGRASAPRGKIMLRVFVHFYGDRVILLLGGYDKDHDATPRRQQREIAEARRLLRQYKRRGRSGRRR